MVVDSAFVSPSSNESEMNSILNGWDFAEKERSWTWYELENTGLVIENVHLLHSVLAIVLVAVTKPPTPPHIAGYLIAELFVMAPGSSTQSYPPNVAVPLLP